MKKVIFSFALSIITFLIFAQDVIFIVSGEYNQNHIPLDSILFENLTNDTRIVFGNLPSHEYYQINLTQKAYWGTVGVNTVKDTPPFKIAQNTPGKLIISYKKNTPTDVKLTAYNINGQTVFTTTKKILNTRNSICVQLSTTAVFFIKIEAPFGTQIFKAIGTDNVKKHNVVITDDFYLNTILKSGSNSNTEDFSFAPGDNLQITAFKKGYFAPSSTYFVYESQNVVFIFQVIDVFTDKRDGKTYETISINEKVWMAENLAYLPSVSPPTEGSYTEPYYYVYDFDGTSISQAKETDNYKIYGVLYNWPAAKTACPVGWHLPTYAEWKGLNDFLIANGYGYGGSGNDIAKSLAAKTNWNSYTVLGTPGSFTVTNNSSGFSALPGGYRYGTTGKFINVGYFCNWWSATEYSANNAWYRGLSYRNTNFGGDIYIDKELGFSVRCVKD